MQRAVLPRVLSLEQVKQVIDRTSIEIEVFGFGSLCVMVEGRCALSSYVTGESPNTHGVCSPAKAVRWQQNPRGLESRLNGVLIDRYTPQENASYPTLCKGRFEVNDETYYAVEEPTSLNTLELLPQLLAMGVCAALFETAKSGKGQVIDAAITDGTASLMAVLYGLRASGIWSDERDSNLLDGHAPVYDTYTCADGRHLAVGALEGAERVQVAGLQGQHGADILGIRVGRAFRLFSPERINP